MNESLLISLEGSVWGVMRANLPPGHFTEDVPKFRDTRPDDIVQHTAPSHAPSLAFRHFPTLQASLSGTFPRSKPRFPALCLRSKPRFPALFPHPSIAFRYSSHTKHRFPAFFPYTQPPFPVLLPHPDLVFPAYPSLEFRRPFRTYRAFRKLPTLNIRFLAPAYTPNRAFRHSSHIPCIKFPASLPHLRPDRYNI